MIIGTGNGEIMSVLANLLKKEEIKAVIDSEYPLREAKDAIEHLKKGRAAGKVIVRIIE